jgi:hypothetical protein
MSFKKKLKACCPPFIWQIFANQINQYKRNQKKYDLRRWWNGEEKKISGNKFKKNFDINNQQVFTCMLDKEIKEIIKIPKKNTFKIKLNKKIVSENFLFSFGIKSFKNSEEGDVKLSINQLKKSKISNPLTNHWNNIYFENLSLNQEEIEITNNTNQTLYFACPIIFKRSQKDEKIKNVCLLILDQVDFNTFNDLYEKGELTFAKKFFDKGINFENCYAAAEWTIPCFESILTTTHPSTHGYFDFKCSKYLKKTSKDYDLLNYFNDQNFSTFGISRSKGHHAGFDFDDNFDRFFYFDDNGLNNIEDDLAIAKKSIDHLNLNKEGKNFLFIHYMSSHSPYIKPNIVEEKNLNVLRFGDPQKEYEDSIIGYGSSKVEPIMDSNKIKNIILRQKERLKDLDIQIGQLLNFIETKNLKQHTMFILTSDHGPNHLSKNKEPMMSKMRLNIPLLIYNPNTSGTTKNKNYICQTDILKLIKNYLINNTDQQNKIINSIQDENVISESIFNEIYQASIRNKNHIYYFSCEFNSLNFTVNLKKQYLDKIENLNSDEKSKEDEIKIYYKNLIFKHLLKSKKLKVLN